ncbi:MAG: TetR/AcrR family transcriptional regulator [Acidobacteriota bacterium]|nr:TetR/AcrR family transcriptional regulator [Acidobacteriota bacterium]
MIASNRPTTAKRTEIADAALRIIGERGITALTMASLAAELGVSPGAPFRHFASRDEILEEVAHRVVDLVGTAFPDPALPPIERLSRLFLARTEVLGRNTGCGRLIFSDQFAKALPEKAAATLRGLVRQTRAYLLAILKEASEAEEVRRDLAPEDLLVPVIGTLQHLAFLTALPADGPPLRRPDPRRALETLLVLLSTPDPPRS